MARCCGPSRQAAGVIEEVGRHRAAPQPRCLQARFDTHIAAGACNRRDRHLLTIPSEPVQPGDFTEGFASELVVTESEAGDADAARARMEILETVILRFSVSSILSPNHFRFLWKVWPGDARGFAESFRRPRPQPTGATAVYVQLLPPPNQEDPLRPTSSRPSLPQPHDGACRGPCCRKGGLRRAAQSLPAGWPASA